jgi:hypothetical protein
MAVRTHVRGHYNYCRAYERDCYLARSTTSDLIVGLKKPLDVGEVKGRDAVVHGAEIKSVTDFSIRDVRIHSHRGNLWFGPSHYFKKGCSLLLSCPNKDQIRSGFPYQIEAAENRKERGDVQDGPPLGDDVAKAFGDVCREPHQYDS